VKENARAVALDAPGFRIVLCDVTRTGVGPMSSRESEAARIFLEAVEQHERGEWGSFVREAAAGDQLVVQRVGALLKAHDESNLMLDGDRLAPAEDIPRPGERPGTDVGPYKLLEEIGEGGMGTVWMAQQTQPVKRLVAVKLIKAGMDSRQVQARFEAERQALALMDHPNVAKVLDAGATASGRPYFVMDLIKGLPITEYCDQSQLTSEERLELFLHVCGAVQHAHQKGIIHRDLKPSNVLVALYDGKPLAKVIDFGIAKALGQRLTEKTLLTGFAQMIGTPLYVSPEQATLSNVDVDTRSDVYSLGVLLYELLTGTTPFEKERFKEAGYDEMRRIIREEDPPRPSARISTLGQAATAVSTRRKSDPRRLSHLFRGELDWIVMKCLEKDPDRRYETANGLAMDVRRYLADEPVVACPPSTTYRMRKFARRHRRALTTAGLMLFFLVALGAGAGWMMRDRSARLVVTDARAESALNDAAALQARGKWLEALEAVKRAEGILAGGGSDKLVAAASEQRSDLEMVLRLEEIWLLRNGWELSGRERAVQDASYARAFQDYGIDVDALEPGEAAARVRARRIRQQLTVALDNWAEDRRSSRKPEDAGRKRLYAVARAADPDPWRNQVRTALERGDRETLNQLAASANVRELPRQSLSLLIYSARIDRELEQSLLRRAQREHPEDHVLNFQIAWSADPEDKVRFYTAALAAKPNHTATRIFLAEALWARGKRDEAIAEYGKVIELNPESALAHNNLAWFLATCPEPKFRDPNRAVELARKAVDLDPKQPTHWNTLGVTYYRTRDWEGAITSLKKAEDLAPGKCVAWNAFFLAMAHWELGEKGEARQEFKQAVRWMEKNDPKNEELQRFRAEAEALMGSNQDGGGGAANKSPK
jgi:serine/threonine protein kinase/tetratricopeptide (TPR) repeat protein